MKIQYIKKSQNALKAVQREKFAALNLDIKKDLKKKNLKSI